MPQSKVRFMLSVPQKVHNWVYAPDLATVARLNERLAKIGNIKAAGRSILGLDSRNLLEIVLESNSDAYLVPAHIWPPWFAVLASRSGFDRIDECFGVIRRIGGYSFICPVAYRNQCKCIDENLQTKYD